jgi:4-amino-4-deoxy-L-arabinose transferase-like glycosyltransferase
MGLGFLCKGPVAVVLAGLPVLLDALCTRDLTPLKRLKPVTVLSVATLLTAPYFLLVWALHGGQPLENFFLTENMRRFAGTSWRHQEFIPPFYEIGVFLAGFAPWSPLVLAALWSHIRLKSYHPQAPTHVRLLLFWVLSPILFFSFSQFKLDYYFLPSMPPAALLVAQALSGNDGISAQSRRIKTAIWAVVLLIVVAIILLTLPVVEMNFSGLRLRWVPYAVAMLSFSASALWTKGQSVRRAVLAGAISIWLTTVASLLIFLPTYGQGRPVERIAASLAPGTTAYLVADAREWAWDLALYLATPEPIQFVSETEVIRLFESLSAHDGPASILMYRQEFEQLPHTGSEPGPVAAFPVRRGDNLTWKSLRHPLWDTLYVVTLERPG